MQKVLVVSDVGVISETPSSSVISVSATPPIVSSGGASPSISIPKATASVDGYLAGADFTTFSGKQAAISGTGFVKAAGTTITFDNTSYAPTASPTFTGIATMPGTSVFNYGFGLNGVGTTTPKSKLHVFGASATNLLVVGSGVTGYLVNGSAILVDVASAAEASITVWQEGIAMVEWGFKASDTNLYITNDTGSGLGDPARSIKLATSGAVTLPGNVGFNGTAPIAKPTLNAAATDLATVIALTNQIRTALINYGLCQ